jgi:hypothetical protein
MANLFSRLAERRWGLRHGGAADLPSIVCAFGANGKLFAGK